MPAGAIFMEFSSGFCIVTILLHAKLKRSDVSLFAQHIGCDSLPLSLRCFSASLLLHSLKDLLGCIPLQVAPIQILLTWCDCTGRGDGFYSPRTHRTGVPTFLFLCDLPTSAQHCCAPTTNMLQSGVRSNQLHSQHLAAILTCLLLFNGVTCYARQLHPSSDVSTSFRPHGVPALSSIWSSGRTLLQSSCPASGQ